MAVLVEVLDDGAVAAEVDPDCSLQVNVTVPYAVGSTCIGGFLELARSCRDTLEL